MNTRHYAPHVVNQVVVVRKRGSLTSHRANRNRDHALSVRDRATKAFAQTYGAKGKLGFHTHVRPDAQLTPEQLWQVYTMCGDVRAAVDSVVRRISTQDWRVTPTEDPAGDEERYNRGLEQSSAVTEGLMEPNDDDDWRSMVAKVTLDTLVFYWGAIELAYESRVLGRGVIDEFVTPYGPSIHPVTDDHGHVLGYYQDVQGNGGGYYGAGDPRNKMSVLSKEQIALLRLQPNTRSYYPVPIIETIAREVTTLVRFSERTMYTADRHEVPTGFLILTGMPPKAEDGVKDAATAQAGRDDKIRILHTMGATAPAQWLRIQEDFKEIQYKDVVHETRKVIWRNFGVSPIEMGDPEGSNRATSTIQLEVGNSHLVEPLLEAWAQLVNKRLLPLLVERFEKSIRAETLCKFEFVQAEGISAEDELKLAQAAEVRIRSGQSTMNEERIAQGKPRGSGQGGDTLWQNKQAVDQVDPVAANDGDDEGVEEPDEDPPELDDDGDDGPDDDGDGGGDGGDGDGTLSLECGPDCDHGTTPHAVHVLIGLQRAIADNPELVAQRRRSELLPSDWQPEGRFANVRTLDLSALFDQVTAYRRAVEPLWDAARREVIAATAAAWRGGTLGSSEHFHRLGQSITALREQWSAATLPLYNATAQIGADGARTVTGSDLVGERAEEQGTAYYNNAMQFLNALMDDLQTRVIANIEAVRTAYEIETRGPQKADPDLGPDSTLDDLLGSVEAAFDANEHRIDNWSGRLVELGNAALLAAVLEHNGETGDGGAGEVVVNDPSIPEPILGEDALEDDPASRGVEWFVQWVAVNDEGTCETCELEAAMGLRPASTLNTTPGGATECRARCRCVLVFWTRAEVASGEAIAL